MPDDLLPVGDDADADFQRDYPATVDDVSPTDAARKWIVARINTDAVDSYKTVVDPMGMDRSAYLKNPVVLWQHGSDTARGLVPIGKNAWLKPRRQQRDVLAKTLFADDEFSRGIFELYRDEVLRGWSVNGTPSKAPGATGPPTAAEVRARPELADCKTIYRAWAIKEYSAVTFAGNDEALTEAVSRGLWMPESLRALAATLPPHTPKTPTLPSLPPLVGRRFSQVEAALIRRTREAAAEESGRLAQTILELARGRI